MTLTRGLQRQWLCFSIASASDVGFAFSCGLLFGLMNLALPSYFPLMEPDSGGYVQFSANRTATYPLFLKFLGDLGVSLDRIVYFQLALFCISLAILVGAALRFGFRRYWILLFVIALASNTYFSSFQRTILSESLSFSATIVATAFLLDFLRTGQMVRLIAAGLFVGITIGVRPAGLMLAPMIPIAALLKRKEKKISSLLFVLAAIASIVVGWAPERVLYHLKHGGRSDTIVPYILTGKAAMLARDGMTFSGPHADALQLLGSKLYKSYAPVHVFLSNLPSWAAWPVLSSYYEAAAQFQVINHDLVSLAKQRNTTPEILRTELGEQVVLANPIAFLKLTLVNYFGQWSITALTFPPTAAAVNSYREQSSNIPLYDIVTATPFHPESKISSLFIYPGFLLAGGTTFLLAIMLIYYLVWPASPDSRQHDLMIAAFFAAMCHSSMLLISFTNVSTPRFLMMVYPHIILSGLFLCRAIWPMWFCQAPPISSSPLLADAR